MLGFGMFAMFGYDLHRDLLLVIRVLGVTDFGCMGPSKLACRKKDRNPNAE